jgi:hypothetical protein
MSKKEQKQHSPLPSVTPDDSPEGAMPFNEAISELAYGEWLTRAAWNDASIYVYFNLEDGGKLYISKGQESGEPAPLILNIKDVEAEDWVPAIKDDKQDQQ